MEVYPHTFFNDLNEYSRDAKKGPLETELLLSILLRTLSEEEFNKNDIGNYYQTIIFFVMKSFISDIYLIHIFHPSHGLINFIQTSLGNNAYKNAQVKALEILYIIVENFRSDLSNENILCIYSISAKIITSNSHAMVKDRLFELLILCLEKLDRCLESDSWLECKNLLNSLKMAVNQKHSDSGIALNISNFYLDQLYLLNQ